MLRTGLAILLVVLGLQAQTRERWLASLEEARRQARVARTPVLCVVLDRDGPSARLEQSFEKSRLLGKLLDGFLCVKLRRADAGALIRKYDLQYSPATVIYTSIGTPMKLVVGPVSTSRYAAHLKAALVKHAELWKPKKSKTPVKVAEPEAPRRRHAVGCPTGCAQCGPAIERALAWLGRRQEKDGRWRKPGARRPCG